MSSTTAKCVAAVHHHNPLNLISYCVSPTAAVIRQVFNSFFSRFFTANLAEKKMNKKRDEKWLKTTTTPGLGKKRRRKQFVNDSACRHTMSQLPG